VRHMLQRLSQGQDDPIGAVGVVLQQELQTNLPSDQPGALGQASSHAQDGTQMTTSTLESIEAKIDLILHVVGHPQPNPYTMKTMGTTEEKVRAQ